MRGEKMTFEAFFLKKPVVLALFRQRFAVPHDLFAPDRPLQQVQHRPDLPRGERRGMILGRGFPVSPTCRMPRAIS